MEYIDGAKADNIILRRLFRKAEFSWFVSDVSKAIGPMIDLVFISLFIGVGGVTVLGYVSPLIMLFELIGTTISNGARNKVSSMVGEGNLEEANCAFSTSVIMGTVISVSVIILVMILSPFVVFLLGARDPEIFIITRQYILGYLFGVPFYTLTRILMAYLQMEGQYKRLNLTAILTTVIDIVGDIVVIFVLDGGMFELGLATSLGYIIPFFINAAFFFRRKNKSIFRLSVRKFRIRQFWDMVKLGAPMGIIKVSNTVGGTVINNLLTAFDMPYLVAAYGVFAQITVFIRASWYAPADTLMGFTGVLVGEEDRESLKEVQMLSLVHSFIYTGVVTVLLFSFSVPLAELFLGGDDPVAIDICTECISVACLSLPFHAIVYNFSNYLMALKRVKIACLYSFLIECGNIVPITFLLLRIVGYTGAWIAKIISMFLLSLMAFLFVWFNKKGKTFRDKMLLLPESFGTTPENELSITANTYEDINLFSKLAIAFALEHDTEKKRASIFGLIVEELAGILANHGFSDGKPHNINVRLIAKEDELIIRFRDDCKLFNLSEYYQLIEKGHENEKDPGVLIVFKMAKEVSYTSTFGANNLIIKI